jgi:hypothetical protein
MQPKIAEDSDGQRFGRDHELRLLLAPEFAIRELDATRRSPARIRSYDPKTSNPAYAGRSRNEGRQVASKHFIRVDQGLARSVIHAGDLDSVGRASVQVDAKHRQLAGKGGGFWRARKLPPP